MSIESALNEISSSGYLINNLFQLHWSDDGIMLEENRYWRCSLRKNSTWSYEYGDALTMEGALLLALSKAINGPAAAIPKIQYNVSKEGPKRQISLAELGL